MKKNIFYDQMQSGREARIVQYFSLKLIVHFPSYLLETELSLLVRVFFYLFPHMDIVL